MSQTLTVGTLRVIVAADTSELDKADQKTKKTTDSMMSRFETLAKSMMKVGAALSVGISAPLASFSIASVRAASDAVEMTNVFNVSFDSIKREANSMADTLAKDFDLAGSTSKQMLGDIGDLMIGFGMGRGEALKFSDSLLRLSGDLTSFRNIAGGMPAATEALFMGVLGNSQALKKLGIAINQRTPEFKDLIKQQMAATGQNFALARAHVVLMEAYRQSPNAIGDYKRTANELANVYRRLNQMTKQLKESFGQLLIAGLGIDKIIKSMADKARDLSTWMMTLSPETKNFIAGMTAFLIIAPPVLLFIGTMSWSIIQLIGAIGAAKVAMIGLSPAFASTISSTAAATAGFNAATIAAGGFAGSLALIGKAGLWGALIMGAYELFSWILRWKETAEAFSRVLYGVKFDPFGKINTRDLFTQFTAMTKQGEKLRATFGGDFGKYVASFEMRQKALYGDTTKLGKTMETSTGAGKIQFAGAAIRGTAEAIRGENMRFAKDSAIEKNTAAQVREQKTTNRLLSKFSMNDNSATVTV